MQSFAVAQHREQRIGAGSAARVSMTPNCPVSK
jgi:hypothetical protein